MLYEPLIDREFAGEDENEVPIDEDGRHFEDFDWDLSDVIHRLLNMDNNRVKPKLFNKKD